jgi:glutamate-1-semialdehyde 2,1-aminomutase
VNGNPPAYRLSIVGARGAIVTTADGREYRDFGLANASHILGRAHELVDRRASESARRCSATALRRSHLDSQAAATLTQQIAHADDAAFFPTQCEALRNAVELARTVTGRRTVIVLDGIANRLPGPVRARHDLVDFMTRPNNGSFSDSHADMGDVLMAEFNNASSLEDIFERCGTSIAAVMIEPIHHRYGCILPQTKFISLLENLCSSNNSLLIADETQSGLRYSVNGTHTIIGMSPDIVVFDNTIANGYPIAAVCSRHKFVSELHRGHLSYEPPSPLALAALIETSKAVSESQAHEHTLALGERLRAGLKWIADECGIHWFSTGFGSSFVQYWQPGVVRMPSDIRIERLGDASQFRTEMAGRGFLMPPGAIAPCYLSAAHKEADVDSFIEAARGVLAGFDPAGHEEQ